MPLAALCRYSRLVTDGGGKVSAALHPIVTRERVAQFLLGLLRKVSQYDDLCIELMPLNGQTGIVVRAGDHIETVLFVRTRQDLIHSLYFVRNPEKLRFVEAPDTP